MNYTASVFLLELGITELYNEADLAKLCNITYDNLYKENELSYLAYLIKTCKIIFKTNSQDRECQTYTIEVKKQNLDDRLKEIDEKYSKSLFDISPSKTFEEKMFKYQRECEARYRSEMEREVQRIKEIEISQLKVEENRKYLKKIEEIRDEYAKEYNDKLETIKRREAELANRINYKEKDLETKIYENNQKYIEQLEVIRMKEEEFKRKYDNELNNLKLQEDKLRFKQTECEHVKESSLKKVTEEIEQFKLEYNRKFEIEKNELAKRKLECEEKEFKNTMFTERMHKLENELKYLSTTYKELNEEYKKLTSQYNTIRKDNEILREELKCFSESDKRNVQMLNNKDLEVNHLREEIKAIKGVLDNQKKLIAERIDGQKVVIDSLNKQLYENTDRYEKQLERVKNYYVELLEKEKSFRPSGHNIVTLESYKIISG
jgi:hypothetical protein